MLEGEHICYRSARISIVTGETGHPLVMGALWLCRRGTQGSEKQNYHFSQMSKTHLQVIFIITIAIEPQDLWSSTCPGHKCYASQRRRIGSHCHATADPESLPD